MIFDGKCLTCQEVANGFYQVTFDIKDQSANVINAAFLSDLDQCLKAIEKAGTPKGLLMTSGKSQFILGADITEFLGLFQKPRAELLQWVSDANSIFNRFESLDCPTVAAIQGFALGGGLELALTCDFRLAHARSKIGLPETKLGLIPGWGGTQRLTRISGVDNALEWISGGGQYAAQDAYKIGAIDGVVETDDLTAAGLSFLNRIVESGIDWKAKRAVKQAPAKLNKTEKVMSYQMGKGFILGKVGTNYPAPLAALEAVHGGLEKSLYDGIKIESEQFVNCALSSEAENLIQVFLGDQYLKKVSKKVSKQVSPITDSAVLGAGIMGGGIAYQTASKKMNILMKDIQQDALDKGLAESQKLAAKGIKRGKIDQKKAMGLLSRIRPVLSYGEFQNVNIVVEAVTENPKIKNQVLSEVEAQVSSDTVITSNTSTIPISDLAKSLKRPENFCGMHFFNPVPKMPLVEVIRGEKSSEETIAKTVSYALQMGKTPIVVEDCPGFLVNRILFPYFLAFDRLVAEGVSFVSIDKAMEKFGWPMGPAYLLDVVGIETAYHCTDVLEKGFPDRMKLVANSPIEKLTRANRYGQKNGKGFYDYTPDKKGRVKKKHTDDVYDVIGKSNGDELSVEEIQKQMMFPMVFEALRCLEDKIVVSEREVDMGILLGLGFPPFRCGPLKYAQDYGWEKIQKENEAYQKFGGMYQAPNLLTDLASGKVDFYKN